MKIQSINKCENLFIKKIFTSENILQNPYWKLTATPFCQKYLMGKKYFELGMLYKSAKEAISDEHPLRPRIATISKFEEIQVNTKDKITKTKAIDINPNNFDRYLLFAHGGGMTITGNRNQRLYKKLSSSIGIYVPEYRGYGSQLQKAGGIDLRKSMAEDLNAGYQELISRGIKDENIIVMGYCAGCSPAIELAKQFSDLKGLILISPYTSFEYMPAAKCFQPYLKTHSYKAPDMENIADVEVPTSIIHTMGDKLIPYEAIERLSKKAKNFQKLYVIHDNGFHSLNQSKIDVVKEIIDLTN